MTPFRLNNDSLKYQRLTLSGYKDKAIVKSNLWQKLSSFMLGLLIDRKLKREHFIDRAEFSWTR